MEPGQGQGSAVPIAQDRTRHQISLVPWEGLEAAGPRTFQPHRGQEAKPAPSAPAYPKIPRCQQLPEIFTAPKSALKTNKTTESQALLISVLLLLLLFLPFPKEPRAGSASAPESSGALFATAAARIGAGMLLF